MNTVVLLLDGARGRYIPRNFVTDQFGELDLDLIEKWGVEHKDAEILAAGPEHELYWETWEGVMGYAECKVDGDKYILQQDGDLWAVSVDRMSVDERRNFGFDLDTPDVQRCCSNWEI